MLAPTSPGLGVLHTVAAVTLGTGLADGVGVGQLPQNLVGQETPEVPHPALLAFPGLVVCAAAHPGEECRERDDWPSIHQL